MNISTNTAAASAPIPSNRPTDSEQLRKDVRQAQHALAEAMAILPLIIERLDADKHSALGAVQVIDSMLERAHDLLW